MQDDWEFCSRDLAATSQLLQPVGSGSGLVFADRFHQLSAAECSSAASLSHDISMKARDYSGLPRSSWLRKAFIVRPFIPYVGDLNG
jgi:hypothetical protein